MYFTPSEKRARGKKEEETTGKSRARVARLLCTAADPTWTPRRASFKGPSASCFFYILTFIRRGGGEEEKKKKKIGTWGNARTWFQLSDRLKIFL